MISRFFQLFNQAETGLLRITVSQTLGGQKMASRSFGTQQCALTSRNVIDTKCQTSFLRLAEDGIACFQPFKQAETGLVQIVVFQKRGWQEMTWELDINSPFEFDYFLNWARHLKKVWFLRRIMIQ